MQRPDRTGIPQADTSRPGEHLPVNRQTEPAAFRTAEEQKKADADINATWDALLAKSAADKRAAEAEAESDDEFLSAEEDVSVSRINATATISSCSLMRLCTAGG